MEIEIAHLERMSESGKSLLRLIQNNGTPTLDLLVRESIQNSLDASLKNDVYDNVEVRFDVAPFDTNDLAPHLKTIGEKLKKLYPKKSMYISVSDKNTVGLTGPVRYEDRVGGEYGNLLKLVYEISKPQEKENSGGSWGLGKTVYFRVGIGLVLYYSRIFDEYSKTYESRMAAALVEDETKIETLLPKTLFDRGIAWWGKKDTNTSVGTHRTIPITNEKEIERILSVFNLSPYKGKETGTRIIIPFVDTKKLLEETVPESDDINVSPPYWTKGSVEEYISVAAQKWYCCRINNRSYNERYRDGRYLKLYVNGQRLTFEKMAPYFQLIQTLYNAPWTNNPKFGKSEIICKNITLRNVFDTTKNKAIAGVISFTRVSASDLKMTSPDNYDSPYRYIDKVADPSYNNPIIAYVRQPAMVISYEITGEWCEGIPTTGKDDFIVGVFSIIDNMIADTNVSLEEYVRNGEKADHMSWSDWTGPVFGNKQLQIINKIQRGVRKTIRENYGEMTPTKIDRRNIGLGRMLADILLPDGLQMPTGVPSDPDIPDPPGPVNPSPSSARLGIRYESEPEYSDNSINLKVKINFAKKKKAILKMVVVSETGLMDGKRWEENIGKKFPVVLNKLTVLRVLKRKAKKPANLYEGMAIIDSNRELAGIRFSLGKSDSFRVVDSLTMEVPTGENYQIEGIINYTIKDSGIIASMNLMEVD